LAEAGSEASDVKSPYFEDIVGSGASQEAPSRAGKALIEEEEERILMSISRENRRILPLLSLTRS